MSQIIISSLFAIALFFGVLLCSKYGWRLGRKRFEKLGEDGHAGLGAIEGAVYGMMGLLIAFTFTGAASRFDHRRNLITSEVNAIGTAWLRLDLLDEATRAATREQFRRYVDAELDLLQKATDSAQVEIAFQSLLSIQNEIWNQVIEASRRDKSQPIAQILLPALNEMFDNAQTRILTTRQHPPLPVYFMLGGLVLISSMLAGFGMAKTKSQSMVHVIGFSAVMALSVYLILDLEYPRLGLVKVTDFDRALVELRASMK